MQALLHGTSLTDPPCGVWWLSEDGEPQSYYLPGHEPEATVGSQVMSQKAPTSSWEGYFRELASGAPFVNVWELIDVYEAGKDGSPPPVTYLKRAGRWVKKAG